MPSSPIAKKNIEIPDNWVHLQKTMIPDSNTACYFSVWYDMDDRLPIEFELPLRQSKGTAWLMWCAIGEDPSVNDSWGHAEEIDDSCRKVLTAIESVYGVSFHDSIWVEMGVGNKLPSE